MSRRILYRNIRARDLLETFLVSAVTGLLAVRFYLYLTGYPQVGNGTLHIAHMLWGGLLMVAAQVLLLAYLGSRVQLMAAIMGGLGFGVFIDELGKFITKDNNYFFHPTIGIIYAIFIILYLVFNFLSRHQQLTEREYQLNVLAQLEEAIEHDMDPAEKHRVHELLEHTDRKDPITKQLLQLVSAIETVPPGEPNLARRAADYLHRQYQWFWRRRSSDTMVKVFFIVEALLFLAAVGATSYGNLHQIVHLTVPGISHGERLLAGQLISSAVATCFVLYGAYCLRSSRRDAFEQFRRATLINLFLTEFFVFSRLQFQALPGFTFNLALLGLISYALNQERHQTAK